jgi:hypothetical protein
VIGGGGVRGKGGGDSLPFRQAYQRDLGKISWVNASFCLCTAGACTYMHADLHKCLQQTLTAAASSSSSGCGGGGGGGIIRRTSHSTSPHPSTRVLVQSNIPKVGSKMQLFSVLSSQGSATNSRQQFYGSVSSVLRLELADFELSEKPILRFRNRLLKSKIRSAFRVYLLY